MLSCVVSESAVPLSSEVCTLSGIVCSQCLTSSSFLFSSNGPPPQWLTSMRVDNGTEMMQTQLPSIHMESYCPAYPIVQSAMMHYRSRSFRRSYSSDMFKNGVKGTRSKPVH